MSAPPSASPRVAAPQLGAARLATSPWLRLVHASVLAALALGGSLSVGACSAAVRTPETVVEEQIHTFHQHMRWGRYDEAASFLPEDNREPFLDELEAEGDWRITEYEVESIELETGNTEATVIVWTQFYALPSTIVDEKTWRERWVYDDVLRIWQLQEREESRRRRRSSSQN